MRLLLTLLFIALFSFQSAAELQEDFDKFFWSYVSPGNIEGINLNVVAYPEIKENPALLNRISERLEAFNPDNLETLDQKIAFWSNTYNFAAIKMVVKNYPVNSIKDIGKLLRPVWDQDIVNVGGQIYTLGHIEHEILRKLGDPSIHFLISCASLSCPDVRAEAYDSARLREQIRDQIIKFLQNPRKGARLDPDNDLLFISSIFKWFKSDFDAYGGVIPYIRSYLPEHIKNYLRKRRPQIRHMNYDWRLNGY